MKRGGAPSPLIATTAESAGSPSGSSTGSQFGPRKAGQPAKQRVGQPARRIGILTLVGLYGFLGACLAETIQQTNRTAHVAYTNGIVHYLALNRAPAPAMLDQFLDFGDALRTMEFSRAAVRFRDYSGLSIRDKTRLQIRERSDLTNAPTLVLQEGEVYFSNRGSGPRRIPFVTGQVKGIPEGTEFLLRAHEGVTEVVMFDGEVVLTTAQEHKTVKSGEHAIAALGQPILIKPRIEAQNVVQWWIYYPAILPVNEIGLDAPERQRVAASLTNYVAGDLIRALEWYPGYPTPADPTTDAGRAYLAQLYLSVGAVDRAQAMLARVADQEIPTAAALRQLLRAVTPAIPLPATDAGSATNRAPAHSLTANDLAGMREPVTRDRIFTASEWLGRSYALQAIHDLPGARRAAQAAAERAPEFGFAWARLAELEFSFGARREAQAAVQRALSLTAKNAQAWVVRGFLHAADRLPAEALRDFDEAIAIDPSLSTAWLGRGLAKLLASRPLFFTRKGVTDEDWQEDLRRAATLEPRRAMLRSYLGKAFADAGDHPRAEKELQYAKELDPADPTPWLYLALLRQTQNRPNEAVQELTRSIELNDNRAVYRSRLMLDEDQAVRSASLARIYRDAGLEELSLREAVRAVSYDYSNYSAHQFLAESYDAMRDPTRFNLRYETVWFNEVLLANILSPVGAGLLSQTVSQQEYGSLFERERFRMTSASEYRSDGQFRQLASQSGVWGHTAYTLDLDYQHNEGTRPNNDLSRTEWYTQIKHQLNDRDSIFLLTKWMDYESGDNFYHADPGDSLKSLRVREEQAPILLTALHREWNEASGSTLLIGRLEDRLNSSVTSAVDNFQMTEIVSDEYGKVTLYRYPRGFGTVMDQTGLSTRFEAMLLEANHHQVVNESQLLLGLRMVIGELKGQDFLDGTAEPAKDLGVPRHGRAKAGMDRSSVYGYWTHNIAGEWRLTLGASGEMGTYPDAFRTIPLSSHRTHSVDLTPKVAVAGPIWRDTYVRGGYFEHFGGVGFEDSVRLEPSQVEGILFAGREFAPIAAVGTLTHAHTRTAALALDRVLSSNWYFGLEGAIHSLDSTEAQGVFRYVGTNPPIDIPPTTKEIEYSGHQVSAHVGKLLGERGSAKLGYHFQSGALVTRLPEVIHESGSYLREEASLHEISLSLRYQLRTGFFSTLRIATPHQRAFALKDSSKARQHFRSSSGPEIDLSAGWRSKEKRFLVQASCINLTDQNYRLSPLALPVGIERERVWTGRVVWQF